MAKKFRTTQEILREKKIEKKTKELTRYFENRKVLESVKDELELPELVGMEVKLSHKDYDARISRNEMSKKFVNWYNENKDNTFVVTEKIRDTFLSPYKLEEVEVWEFVRQDLILLDEIEE